MALPSALASLMLHVFIIIYAFTCVANAAVISNCDVASQWSKASVSTTIKQEGTGSIVWNQSVTLAMSMTGVSEANVLDFTQASANTFNFWLYLATPKPNGKVMLTIYSENSAVDGSDYYSYSISSLNFTGWRSYSPLFAAFTPNRSPAGWNKISGLTFNGQGWDIVPDTSIVLYIDNITVCTQNNYEKDKNKEKEARRKEKYKRRRNERRRKREEEKAKKES